MFQRSLCMPDGVPDPLEEASRGSQAVLAERVIQLQATGVLRAENPEIIGLALWSQIHGITTIVLDIVLGVLAAVIVAWFSRQREYRADAGAAALMGRKQPMINALARLGGLDPGQLPQSVQTMGINGRPSGVMALFSSHPPIEDRIRALQQLQ